MTDPRIPRPPRPVGSLDAPSGRQLPEEREAILAALAGLERRLAERMGAVELRVTSLEQDMARLAGALEELGAGVQELRGMLRSALRQGSQADLEAAHDLAALRREVQAIVRDETREEAAGGQRRAAGMGALAAGALTLAAQAVEWLLSRR